MRHPLLNRRSLAIGVGLLLLGLALSPLLRPRTPEAHQPRSVEFEPIAARTDSAAATLTLESSPAAEAASVAAPTRAPETAEPEPFPQPPAFEDLVITDPRTSLRIQPVSFSELRAVHEPRSGPSVESVADVYFPGCVGGAKRTWAGGGAEGPGIRTMGTRRNCEPRDRGIVLDASAGRCSNPARDRGLPAMCGRGDRR